MTPSAPPPPSCVLVIFGAAGDLTQRLLLPVLSNLKRAGLLPANFAIVGIARSPKTDDAFREELVESLSRYGNSTAPAADADWLGRRMFYLAGDVEAPATYQKLAALLARTDAAQHTGGNYLFYLATAPQVFATIPKRLADAGLLQQREGRWRRVIIEKPFGTDLYSAHALNRALLEVLAEEQIYRIDHYLGKETVQNIMVLRFGNGLFEPLWSRHYIDHVQITVAETVGVERRGGGYQTTSALWALMV